MDDLVFDDALTGNRVTVGSETFTVEEGHSDPAEVCETLFYPGCSLINFAPQLVQRVYDLLLEHGMVQSMSLFCCGRYLSYGSDQSEYQAYTDQLVRILRARGVKRIIAACPNCADTLIRAIDATGQEITVEALPEVLVKIGCHIELPDFAQGPLTVHDSCPDRHRGVYAAGTRALFSPDDIIEMPHNREHSRCCGVKILSAGKEDAAVKCAEDRVEEARQTGAKGIVVACMSCANYLADRGDGFPVYHYLELLLGERIPWEDLSYMTFRSAATDSDDTGRPLSPRSYIVDRI